MKYFALGRQFRGKERYIFSKTMSMCSMHSSLNLKSFLFLRYMKYLYPYECSKRKLSTPAELQAAIDGNRRDGRRTFGSFASQGMTSDGAHGFNSPSPPLSASSFTANHSPTMVSTHRTSPGPPATPTEEVEFLYFMYIFVLFCFVLTPNSSPALCPCCCRICYPCACACACPISLVPVCP